MIRGAYHHSLDNCHTFFSHHLDGGSYYFNWGGHLCFDLFCRRNKRGRAFHDLLLVNNLLLTNLPPPVLHEQREDRARQVGVLALVEGIYELVDALSRLNQDRLALMFNINVLQSNEMYLFILDGPPFLSGDFVNQQFCIGQQGLICSVRDLYLLLFERSVSRPRGFDDIIGDGLISSCPHSKLKTS